MIRRSGFCAGSTTSRSAINTSPASTSNVCSTAGRSSGCWSARRPGRRTMCWRCGMTDPFDDPPPDRDASLGESRDWLLERVDHGAKCPLCQQFTKVYRRKLTGQTIVVLITMFRKHAQTWCYLPEMGLSRGDEAKARYWGLIEPYPDAMREDGSKRVGVWRLTDKGVAFLQGRMRVPKYAKIYDGRCLGLDHTELVDVRDCLGTKFNYEELMGGY